MIRHGQASFGSANYDLFSETGVLQSRILAEYLLAVGLAPDALYSGVMERQKDTAGAMVALSRFYADKKAFQRVFEKILMGWVKGEYRKPGVATWEDFRERVRGGLGMTDDTIISFFFRHERAARIYDGADEVHKMSVAKRILKEYAGRTVR